MRHPAFLLSAALLVTACLAAPARLFAQPLSNVDGAFNTFDLSGAAELGRNDPELLTFTWYPAIPVGDAGYALSAQCTRADRLGGPPGGTNRLVFNATLAPVDGSAFYKVKQKRARLSKRGVQKRLVLWSGRQFEDIALAGMGSGVVVHFEIGATGKVNFGDSFGCSVSMIETNPRGIVAAGGSAADANPRSVAREHAASLFPAPGR